MKSRLAQPNVNAVRVQDGETVEKTLHYNNTADRGGEESVF